MPQYNHALCSYSIPRVKYTSAFNFVASYSDYEMIILPISFPQPIKTIPLPPSCGYKLMAARCCSIMPKTTRSAKPFLTMKQ